MSVEVQALLEEGGIRFADHSSDSMNLAAYCPFHKDGAERKPSFFVYVGPNTEHKSTGASFCHTCGTGWTLGYLLKRLGVKRAVVDSIIEIANESRPHVSSNYYARVDLSNPTLPEETLSAWDYAPTRLLRAGFSKETLRYFDIGFDRNTQRITFPLRNQTGLLVGVSGRSVTGDASKYKVYRREFHSLIPGYEVDKSKTLWGLDKIYHTAMNAGLRTPVVVCEGFKAAMWVYQAGHKNVVALTGTYCSPQQKMLLGRITNEVVLFLDNDPPGRKATWKILKTLDGSLDVRLADYSLEENGKSPDDLDPSRTLAVIKNSLTKREWRNRWHSKRSVSQISKVHTNHA